MTMVKFYYIGVPIIMMVQTVMMGYIVSTLMEINEKMGRRRRKERMNGEWVKISPANIYEWSKCGKNVMTGDISECDFCHGCGADMRGGIDGGSGT
jgi:hypothetical protein